MLCIHRSDFFNVGGFDKETKGWGMEDVLMFEKLIKHEQVDVIRAVDSGIYHL
jgi:predicted glycosyltransferase involved in capsule biosynthesis